MLSTIDEFVYPFRALDALSREVDRLFEGARRQGRPVEGAWPLIRVSEQGDAFVLDAEMPGVLADDLGVTVEEDTLTLSVQRKGDAPEGYAPLRRERSPFKVTRTFRLGTLLDAEKVEASLKDGVLRVLLPKAAPNRPRKVTIRAV